MELFEREIKSDMTDLDNTQILTADDSLLQNSSTFETEASLKILSGTESNIYPIGKETIIGRSNPSDLVISAPSLSKQHAKITISNGQYFITDLGSSNKTFQNKVQLQPNVCYALHNGDEIKLGDIICSFEEHKAVESNKNVIPKTDVDVIPSTQTITDSYEDQEPTQPMKVWNGNSNNRLSRTSLKNSDESVNKQNGVSSSFISSVVNSTSNESETKEDDDSNVVIGNSTVPSTVPLVIESTQINNDDQLEIVSSSQTNKISEDDINNIVTVETTKITTDFEITETQAYDLEPTNENQIADTQAYELESESIVTDFVETEREEVHQVVVNGDTIIEQVTTKTTTTTAILSENDDQPIVQTLAYDLQPTEEPSIVETTTTTTTTTTTVEIDEPPAQTLAYDLQPTEEPTAAAAAIVETTTITTTKTTTMGVDELPAQTLAYDLEPTNEQINLDETEPAVCTDTQAYDLNEEIAETSPRPASETMEVVPASKLAEQLADIENASEDTTNTKQQVTVIIDPETIKEVANDIQMETDSSIVDENQTETTTEQSTIEVQETIMEEETPVDTNQSLDQSEQKTDESIPSSTLETSETQEDELEDEDETDEATVATGTTRGQRGVPRRAARRARGRRGGAAAARARVVSTRLHSGRRNAPIPTTNNAEDNNATLEETINTETEESPKKTTTPVVEQKTTPATPTEDTSASNSNIRVSARIKARVSTGRNRQFPYTDDYVDLDDLEKQVKATTATPSPSTTTRRSNRGGSSARSSSTPQKRISLRQQPIDASESPNEKDSLQKDNTDVYDQMETGGENEEPDLSRRSIGRKRKSTTPVATTTTTKRTRQSTTPQAEPRVSTRRKQSSTPEQPSPVTPKRGRKSTKTATPDTQTSEDQSTTEDRPVRIALSSHLNFDQNHFEILRKLGFEIMDESCPVDALVVDRIRRTKKFFMCLARGAHILSPTWIEIMIKENRYIPYEKYYLEDTTAETRYGFQLRESVRLAKQRPIFENYKFFCTKDTSPPYDDLKDIVEAAGGKFIEKILNMNKPGKDLICIVAQAHKSEFEELFKKGVPVVSEEFALSGISKQKLDFDAFSLFQTASKSNGK